MIWRVVGEAGSLLACFVLGDSKSWADRFLLGILLLLRVGQLAACLAQLSWMRTKSSVILHGRLAMAQADGKGGFG